MMRIARLLFLAIPLLVAPSCGGSAFSSGGSADAAGPSSSSSGAAGDGGSRSDGAQGDAAAEASPPVEAGPVGTYCGPDLKCNGTGTQQGTVCCVSNGSPPAYACAGANCGCDTQLDCASDAQCGALRCCIRNETDSACASGHWVAKCASDCVGGSHMCVPGAGPMQCTVTQSCSPDTSGFGLPPQSGFGVCK